MTGWAVQVEIPLRELGRVRLPRARMRVRAGWVRLGLTPDKQRVLATLEDREGRLSPAPTQVEACARAARLGQAVALHLMRHNRYEPGEDAGKREQVRVVVL